jgi:hypothetical protein
VLPLSEGAKNLSSVGRQGESCAGINAEFVKGSQCCYVMGANLLCPDPHTLTLFFAFRKQSQNNESIGKVYPGFAERFKYSATGESLLK